MVFNDMSPTFIVPQIDGHSMPVEMAPLVFGSDFFKPLCGTKYARSLLNFQPRQAFLAPEMVFNDVSPTFIVPQIDGHFMPVEMAPLVFRSEFFKPLCGTKYACDLLDFQPRQAFLAPDMVFNEISHTFMVPQIDSQFMLLEWAPLDFGSDFLTHCAARDVHAVCLIDRHFMPVEMAPIGNW